MLIVGILIAKFFLCNMTLAVFAFLIRNVGAAAENMIN